MAVNGGLEPTRQEQRKARSLRATGREPVEFHRVKSGLAASRLVRPVAARSPSSVYVRRDPGEALHNKLCYFKLQSCGVWRISSSDTSSSYSLNNSKQGRDYYVKRGSCLPKISREEPPASYRHQAKLSTSDDFRLETCKLHERACFDIFCITCGSCAHTSRSLPKSGRLSFLLLIYAPEIVLICMLAIFFLPSHQ